jgi:hypothetical protein
MSLWPLWLGCAIGAALVSPVVCMAIKRHADVKTWLERTRKK